MEKEEGEEVVVVMGQFVGHKGKFLCFVKVY